MGVNANKRRTPAKRDEKNARSIAHLAGKQLKLAAQTPIKFEKFSVAERIQTLRDGGTLEDCPIEKEIYWDGTEPMIAVDKDDVPIVFYIPGLHSIKSMEIINQAVDSYQAKHQSTIAPKPTEVGGRNRTVKFVEGRDARILEFVQGHPHIVLEASSSSSSVGSAVPNIKGRVEIDRAFKFHRAVNSHILSFIDPAWHDVLSKLRAGLNEASGTPDHVIDPSVFPSHTMTWNCTADDHRDDTDHPRGWTALNLGGDFTSGGDVKFKSLGLRVDFLPGSFMMVRGCLITYSIADYTGGDRFGYTSYIPASIIEIYLSNFKVNPVLAPLTNITEVLRLVSLKVTQPVTRGPPIRPTNTRVDDTEKGTKRKREDEDEEEEEGEIRAQKAFDGVPSSSRVEN